jgi:hypothetical protein
MYIIQRYFICRPSDSAVSEDARIEPKIVTSLALTSRRSNHSARSHTHSARSHPLSARSHPLSARSHPLSARSHPLEVVLVTLFSLKTVLTSPQEICSLLYLLKSYKTYTFSYLK